jgi:Domain of unknown function (DUF4333)
MPTAMKALATVAIASAVLSGCTVTIDQPTQSNPNQSNPAKVSKGDLQMDITRRLITAGQTPQSVTCQSDLVGQLGQSTRCDVTMGAANSFEPIVTVTGLEGTKVNYDISPAVSKTQLTGAVTAMVINTGNAAPDLVSCQSGLDGKVGAVAYCDVTAGGVTTRRTAEVTDVSGLSMKYGLIPELPKTVVEGSLLSRLRQTGQHPDTANCAGGLERNLGSSVECTTATAGQNQTYIITVTAVQGDNITFTFALKP